MLDVYSLDPISLMREIRFYYDIANTQASDHIYKIFTAT